MALVTFSKAVAAADFFHHLQPSVASRAALQISTGHRDYQGNRFHGHCAAERKAVARFTAAGDREGAWDGVGIWPRYQRLCAPASPEKWVIPEQRGLS